MGNRDADEQGHALTLDRPHRIFSTPHVASGPFRAGLAAVGAVEAWTAFLAALDAACPDLVSRLDVVPREDPVTGTVDGAVFYEGHLTEEIEELSASLTEARERAEPAKKALRALLSKVRALGEPDAYYAILLADGDHMGRVIDACPDF